MSYDKIPEGATLKVQPYKISFPQTEVDHFYQSIRLSKLAPRTYENLQPNSDKYGVTLEWMSQAKKEWTNSYNWRAREKHFNSFPNFRTLLKDDESDFTFNMHFAALFSNKPNAIPIVFLHGWPGSFLEFLGVLDVLRNKYTPDTLPYHVIVPSLPGYCLSNGPPPNRDFRVEDIARIINNLMLGLNLPGYIAQGGDIGAYTCRPLSTYPACRGIHLNFSLMGEPPNADALQIDDVEKQGLSQAAEFAATQSAYALEHGTRPSTIGFVLSSSPLALLAWIGEKFIAWTDETPSLEAILDSVSLYWFTESFARCIYPYRQFHYSSKTEYTIHDDPKYYVRKPFGYSWFPREVAPMPRAWVEMTGELVWFRRHERGGHFAALERPGEMVEDVEEFIGQILRNS